MPDSADTYLHRVGEIISVLFLPKNLMSVCLSLVDCSFVLLQVGRAGRFGTKGLAITFVASASDSDVLNQVGILL